MVYALLVVLVLILCVKILLLKKTVREIAEGFADRLRTDTNTLIDVSSQDRDIRALASQINRQLRVLRDERLRCRQGDRELKEAVTNISHDLRTPLTAIFGYLYLTEKTDNVDEMRAYLDVIGERTETMKRLTDELFRYSLIRSDDAVPETEPVDLRQILEDSIVGCYAAFTARGIVPEVRLPERRIIRNLNRGDTERIFSNLLSNALKYSGGDLSVTLSDAGEVVFSNTSDSITALDAERLFERFYTVETARNSTGLGLSIARTLTERMGGRISAEYTAGKLYVSVAF
ncbi:MAG: HAMP domain-containing histidine kinase [Clostridia bacterium]|nr:HAMP domain-containing histidine kinase [Clostridia bacterium]MBR5365952.1 HAMP domain-containing histidine kinase [Clostridia bacterium]